MSHADERRREQAAFDRDQEQATHERPDTAPVIRHDELLGWASTCTAWRVGIHERTKEDRLAGRYKCKWCSQVFEPPTEADLKVMRERALQYQRPQHVSRRR